MPISFQLCSSMIIKFTSGKAGLPEEYYAPRRERGLNCCWHDQLLNAAHPQRGRRYHRCLCARFVTPSSHFLLWRSSITLRSTCWLQAAACHGDAKGRGTWPLQPRSGSRAGQLAGVAGRATSSAAATEDGGKQQEHRIRVVGKGQHSKAYLDRGSGRGRKE